VREVIGNPDTGVQPKPNDMMSMPNFDYGTVVVITLSIE